MTRIIRVVPRNNGRALVAALAMVALLFGGGTAFAATRTWTGAGGDNHWSTAANWDSGSPVAGDDLVFPAGAAQLTNVNDLPAGTSFNTISFTGPASSYDLSGNGIQLAAGITADNNGTNAIHFPIQLTASQAFNISGDRFQPQGVIDLGAHTLTLTGGTGVLTQLSPTGTGGVASSINVVFMGGSASYTGPTNINAGVLVLGAVGLNPASVVTVSSGGRLQFANGGSAGPVTVSSTSWLMCEGGGTSQIGNLTDLTMQSGSNLRMSMHTAGDTGQLNASGNVSLGGATLHLSWAFTSSVGDAFTLINKTSTGAVSGTFNGLAEGATFVDNGRTYQITYTGGDGNDVIVTDVTGGPTPTSTPTPTVTATPAFTPTPAVTPTPTTTATPPPVPGIPTSSGKGLLLLLVLFAGAGVLLLRRHSS